jgi:hypothetical protein
MGIQLPPELASVAAQAGVRWPEADEDKMRQSAQAWRDAGTKLTTLTRDADRTAGGALGAVHGDTGDAARRHWSRFVHPDHGHLTATARGCHHAADRLDHAANQVGAAKLEIVRNLVNLAKNSDAAHGAAASGHPNALLGLDTAIRGTAANVQHITNTLERAVQPATGVDVSNTQNLVNPNPGQHRGIFESVAAMANDIPQTATGAAGNLVQGVVGGPTQGSPGPAGSVLQGTTNVLSNTVHAMPQVAADTTGYVGDTAQRVVGPPGQVAPGGHGSGFPVVGNPEITGPVRIPPSDAGSSFGHGGAVHVDLPTPPTGVPLGPGQTVQAGLGAGVLDPSAPAHVNPVQAPGGPLPGGGSATPGGQLPGLGAPPASGGPALGIPSPGGGAGPIPVAPAPRAGGAVPGVPFGGAAPVPAGPLRGGAAPGAPIGGATPGAPVGGGAPMSPNQPRAGGAVPGGPPGTAAPTPGEPRAGGAAPGAPAGGAAPPPAANQPRGAASGGGAPVPTTDQPRPADGARGAGAATGSAPDQPRTADRAGGAGPTSQSRGAVAMAIPPSATQTPAPGQPGGPTDPQDTPDVLFWVHMFPMGHMPVRSERPARQLPPPPAEMDYAPGLRFGPSDHPEHHRVESWWRLDELRAGVPPLEPQPGLPADDPRVAVLAEGHDPLGGQHERDWDRRYLVRLGSVTAQGITSEGQEYAWPPGEIHPEGGSAPGEPEMLAEGTVIDRFGAPDGRVFSLDGTEFARRSLPHGYLGAGYHRYRVTRPVPAWRSVSAAWFGQSGGGERYRTTYSAAELLALGYLSDITGGAE